MSVAKRPVKCDPSVACSAHSQPYPIRLRSPFLTDAILIVLTPLSQQELTNSRRSWGAALVAISQADENGGIETATKLANSAPDAVYGSASGGVLFKPTLASEGQTFRTTREGALTYFVGHDGNYPPNSGVRIKG